MSFSKAFSLLCISFVAGVFLSVPGLWLGFLLAFLVYYFYRFFLLSLFSLVFFLFGAFCFLYAESFTPPPLQEFEGTVDREPLLKGDRKEIVVCDDFCVLLFVDRHKDIIYGDKLHVEGEFREPEPLYYERYLKKEGVYYTSFYPETEVVERSPSFLFSLKDSFRERMHSVIPPPEVFILEAMTMGDRGSFSDELGEKLSIAGVRHITAVSGMHIVIISSLLFSLFSLSGFPRKASSFTAIFFVILFVLFVGAPASAVRAGIMGSLLLISRAINSTAFSLRSVVFAASGMLFFNPLLVYDTGFHLSFLAVLGIILLFPLLKEKFSAVPLRKKEGSFFFLRRFFARFFKKRERVCEMICVTLSAVAFTAPLIVYNFGNFPLFSIFSNLLIVPLLPFIFVFGVIGSVSGISFFALPAYLLLSFLLFVVEFFSSLPFAALKIEDAPLFLLFLFYATIMHYINRYKSITI